MARLQRERITRAVPKLASILLPARHSAADHVAEVWSRTPLESQRCPDVPGPDPPGLKGGTADGAASEASHRRPTPGEVADLVRLIQRTDLDPSFA